MVVHLAYSAYIGSQKSILVIARPGRPLLLRTGFQGTYPKAHTTSNPEYLFGLPSVVTIIITRRHTFCRHDYPPVYFKDLSPSNPLPNLH